MASDSNWLTFKLEGALADEVRKYSADQERTPTYVVKSILSAYLAQHGNSVPVQEIVEQAIRRVNARNNT